MALEWKNNGNPFYGATDPRGSETPEVFSKVCPWTWDGVMTYCNW